MPYFMVMVRVKENEQTDYGPAIIEFCHGDSMEKIVEELARIFLARGATFQALSAVQIREDCLKVGEGLKGLCRQSAAERLKERSKHNCKEWPLGFVLSATFFWGFGVLDGFNELENLFGEEVVEDADKIAKPN